MYPTTPTTLYLTGFETTKAIASEEAEQKFLPVTAIIMYAFLFKNSMIF